MAEHKSLSLFDCVCIIVGVIIGSGIYGTTPLITSSAGGASTALAVWILGGVLVLNALLSYAELVTAQPRRGGDYAFLSLAYGRWLGFLFAWTEFWIIRPANVGAMAFVYALYANELAPWGEDRGMLLHALAAVVALTLINLIGIRTGARTQNLLSVLKVSGLLLVLVAGFLGPQAPVSASSEAQHVSLQEVLQPQEDSSINLELALILVLFTYGGANDVSYVAAEVKDPHRNLPRSLIIGITLVIAVYLLVNIVFLRVLGYNGVANSNAVAADMMQLCVGDWGARAISVLVCISCLGAISAMIFTGSRIYHALGVEHPVVGWLGYWNPRGVPHFSVLAQGAVMAAMVVLLGRDNDGFQRLAVYAAPFFWTFFTLVSCSLFYFRWERGRDPEADQSHIHFAPFYPIGPLLFVASSGFMLYASMDYLYASQLRNNPWSFRTMWALIVLLSGLTLGIRSRGVVKREED